MEISARPLIKWQVLTWPPHSPLSARTLWILRKPGHESATRGVQHRKVWVSHLTQESLEKLPRTREEAGTQSEPGDPARLSWPPESAVEGSFATRDSQWSRAQRQVVGPQGLTAPPRSPGGGEDRTLSWTVRFSVIVLQSQDKSGR